MGQGLATERCLGSRKKPIAENLGISWNTAKTYGFPHFQRLFFPGFQDTFLLHDLEVHWVVVAKIDTQGCRGYNRYTGVSRL